MWGVAALLLIAFALILSSRIARTRGMGVVFLFLGLAAWMVAVPHVVDTIKRNEDVFIALVSFPFVSVVISDLIAIPILRKRVIPPCVRAKRLFQGGHIALGAIVSFLFIAFFDASNERFRFLGQMTFLGLATVSIIFYLLLGLLGKTEICGNGVWQWGRFWPWEDYKSFSWKWKDKDSVELRLVPKSWTWPTRLVVPPEDRETVHQLLEANLPDLSK